MHNLTDYGIKNPAMIKGGVNPWVDAPTAMDENSGDVGGWADPDG